MKLFLDSADITEIRRAVDAGLIDGITTNPSLMAKVAGPDRDPRDLMAEICRTVDGPISAGGPRTLPRSRRLPGPSLLRCDRGRGAEARDGHHPASGAPQATPPPKRLRSLMPSRRQRKARRGRGNC